MSTKNDPLSEFNLTDKERAFCSPDSGDHSLLEMFPQIDAFLQKVEDSKLRDRLAKKVEFYRNRPSLSGNLFSAVSDLMLEVTSPYSDVPEAIRKMPEFVQLQERYKFLSEAHSAGFKEVMREAGEKSAAFEAEQEKRRREMRAGETGRLPKLGVPCTFETPQGLISGTLDKGAEMGGPYTINTPEGKVRIPKIK